MNITVKTIIKLQLLCIPLLICLFTPDINTNVFAGKLGGGIERLEDGIEDYKNGKYSEAILNLGIALIQLPEDDKEDQWKAHFYLGSSYLLMGDEDEAKKEYINAKKIIKNKSPDPEMHHTRIVELFNAVKTSGAPEVSSDVSTKVHAKRIGGGIERLKDGIEDYKNGRYSDAIFNLGIALIQLPEDNKEDLWKAHFYSGSSYLLLEDVEEAKKEFKLAQALIKNKSPGPEVHPARIVKLFHSIGGPTVAEAREQISWRRSFDEQGRLSKQIDPAGRETGFEYSSTPEDSFRVTKTPPEGIRVVWDYNKRGSLTNMTDGAGAVSYGHDDLGRINLIKRSKGTAIAYDYDGQDRIISLKVGDFYELNYAYDFLGRLESINTPAGAITYEYLTGQGLLVRTLPNGVRTTWESEVNGQLRKITHGIPVGKNEVRILAEYTYEYRSDGLISTIGERSERGEFATGYKYDKVGRLVEATESTGQKYRYEYDKVGNRLGAKLPGSSPQSCSYDWAGRLISVNDNECTHDAAGNLTSITIGDTAMKYRYNPDGQLQNVNGKVSYRYDGDGRLVRRKSGKTETTFIPDPFSEFWQPLTVDNGTGGRTLVVWARNTPLIMIQDGKPEYMLHDHLGSVRLIVDEKGQVSQWIDYDTFGVMKDPTSPTVFAPRYAGLFWDAQAQAYMTLARAYEPTTGCFVGPDPQLRIPSDSKHNHSLYAYCGGDPVNFMDINGAESLWAGITSLFNKPLLPYIWTNTYNSTLKPGNERDRVIMQISAQAWKETKGKDYYDHVKNAHNEVLKWQNDMKQGGTLYQDKFGNSVITPTADEWRTTEHYWLIRRRIETGTSPVIPAVSPGRSAKQALDRNFIPKWNLAHFAGERGLLKPGEAIEIGKSGKIPWGKMLGRLNPRHGDEKYTISRLWLPGTKKEVEWAERAKRDAIGMWDHMNVIEQRRNISLRNDNRSSQIGKGLTEQIRKIRIRAPRKRDDVYDTVKLSSWRGGPGGPGGGGFGGGGGGSWGSGGGGGGPWGPGGGGGGSWGSGGGRGGPWGPGGGGSSFRDMTPSTVGGVYLGGSGKMLDGIGLLEGVALDANNNLILLSKSGDEINLPPLRLDDVVTIFRSVYIHGEGPTVTIDPSPVKPEESAMIVKHGKATENTYVGWVLYQADRIMKGYSLGADNLTAKYITSSVPGYDEVLDTLYFGDDTPETYRKGGRWERFWIVPSYVRRFNAVHNNDLTLVDVPLKLKTQLMKWENGKLVDDPNGKSSAGALKFTEWFTRMYESIAREQYLTPPPETGITKPVPVFSELRRIALITALAEKLRDQGVTMPFWMRGYEVPLVHFDETTPALLMTRSNGKIQAKVLGGVGLSPDDKDVKQFTQASELKQLSEPEQKRARKALVSATTLSNTVRKSVAQTKPLKIHKIPVEDDTYYALPVPGSDTRALAPCQLEEVDMVVPIEGGYEIRLSRNYHSFFEPSGLWGKGWTLNLPWLEKVLRPIERKDSAVQYRTEYELLTPLNSLYACFSRVEEVPALNNSQLQTPVKECGFFGLADGTPAFLNVPTRKLLRKDGGVWHFTRDGGLVAIDKNGFRTVYLTDQDGRLSQIAGLLGQQKMASIDLSYDDRGRLEGATGRSYHGDQKIGYEYNTAGKLSYVLSAQGKLGYQYTGPLVSSVTWMESGGTNVKVLNREKMLRSFEYNENGQLIAETGEDGQRIAYNVKSDHEGNALTVTNPSGNTSDTTRYDAAYRPVEARYDNGTQAAWTYSDNGKNVLSIKSPEGGDIKITESADQRRQTFEVPDMPVLTKEYDEAGRLTNVIENGRNVLSRQWHPNGYLKAVEDDNCAAQPIYNEDGLTTKVVLSPPDEKEQPTHWQETEMDFAGRPVKITDNRHLHIVANYDNKGNIKQVAAKRDGENFGYDIFRDDEGRIQNINSSWDKRQFTYDKNGTVENVTIEKQGRKGLEQSVSEFESGQLIRAKQFDGGEIAISYYGEGPHANLPEQVTCANGLNLDYHYDPSNKLQQVNIGKQSQVALDYDTRGRIIAYTYRSVKD